MKKFKKIVAVDPVSIIDSGREELKNYADEVIFHSDYPKDDTEIIDRIGNADGVLVSYATRINKDILEKCPNIKYVGMCCSLYSEESANVDIAFARTKGITVLGIRDYGDRGVVEYVMYQLIRILHGFDFPLWDELPLELTDLKVGIIGLGVSGGMIADALKFMGSDVSYYSRTRKPEKEKQGIQYKELHQLLKESQVVFACLNKNVILLNDEEFKHLGSKKILFNTSIGPASDLKALKNWLDCKDNYYCCDTEGAIGDNAKELINYPNILCAKKSAGMTKQAYGLLTKKVLDNIKTYLSNNL